ncbi:alcohol dehydrogenase [Novosphingobium colocasiae]|uniref:Alcohol dehydrogenase n=2 Tax=Novosphingobium colocasiae TaxID=1256513 RepID=A0A918UJK0_9SPHN|nr:alcohol dehydrogenase [Novosphingobium colocasiae]
MYRGPGEIHYEDIPDARLPDAHGAVVKATVCSICGTDLHPYHTDMGFNNYCIGHEAVGEVVEVGAEVRSFAKGDRVLIPASIGCGRCKPCLSGHVYLCDSYPNGRAYGQGDPTIPGCQAEAIAVTMADNNLFLLPEGMSDDLGIMLTDNIATAWYCARRGRIEPGNTVAVIGLGSVGLQAVMAALAMGAERVFGLDLLEDRRKDACAIGATDVGGEDVVARVLDATDGNGVDVVLDASGGRVTTALAIDLVKRGGRISQIGVSEQFEIPFPILGALFKNVEFHTGVCSVQAEVPHLMAALASGKLDAGQVGGIITHRMNLSDGAEAYRLFDSRPDGLKKIVLDPTR